MAAPPLVSVIVRTMGRASLGRALACVRAQTHRPIEIVLVDAAGRPQRVFGGPFDRAALMSSNHLAIHAVLFHRSFVDAGCRFDETLPTFEDWDFWIALSRQADFAFTGRRTAICRASSGESGAGVNLDRERVLELRERLMRKWGA